MLRKRKQPTPGFKLPAPFQPITGERAPLVVKGVFPYVAMMQVAAEDTERDYVLCRGFDVRINRFIDYAVGDDDKPGIPVAKPFGKRYAGAYRVAQIFPAILPLQTDNPSPSDVPWRVGQNPGVSTVTSGHPADLDEEVEALKDTGDIYINWMLLDEGEGLVECCLAENHPGYGVVFEVYVGKWKPTNNGWCYEDNLTGEPPALDPTKVKKAIDWRYGTPYPDAGARGLFMRHTGYCDGVFVEFYEVVSLDCEPPPIDCGEDEVAACSEA